MLFDGAHTRLGLSTSSVFRQIYTRLLSPIITWHPPLNIQCFQWSSTVQFFLSLHHETRFFLLHTLTIIFFCTRLLYPILNNFLLTVFEQKVEWILCIIYFNCYIIQCPSPVTFHDSWKLDFIAHGELRLPPRSMPVFYTSVNFKLFNNANNSSPRYSQQPPNFCFILMCLVSLYNFQSYCHRNFL